MYYCASLIKRKKVYCFSINYILSPGCARSPAPQAYHAVLPDMLFQGVFEAAAPLEMSLCVIGAIDLWGPTVTSFILLIFSCSVHQSYPQGPVDTPHNCRHQRSSAGGITSSCQVTAEVRGEKIKQEGRKIVLMLLISHKVVKPLFKKERYICI